MARSTWTHRGAAREHARATPTVWLLDSLMKQTAVTRRSVAELGRGAAILRSDEDGSGSDDVLIADIKMLG